MENANTSPFERLPGEIRNLIYRFCLKHDENTITPLPTEYELATLRRKGRKIPCTPHDTRVRPAPNTAKIDYQAYNPKWPAVALLGVNHLIHNEVLPILFGGSVWRLSCQFTWPSGHGTWPPTTLSAILHAPYLYWEKYGEHFRDLSCEFSAMDLSHHYILKCSRIYQNKSSPDPLEGCHDKLLEILCGGPMAAKLYRVSRMKNLRMIQINLGTLACPGGCCRTPVLEKLIALWKPDMIWRVQSWRPTKALIKRINKRSFRCYIKGQSGALGVHGLWTKQEAEMVLKHWWRAALESPEKNELFTKRECSEQGIEEFWANTEFDPSSSEDSDLAKSGAQSSVSDGAKPICQRTGKGGKGRLDLVRGWLSKAVKKAWFGRNNVV